MSEEKAVESQEPEKKTELGLDENIESLLAYSLGFITGIVFFLLEKKSELVRFHAMQSILCFVSIFIMSLFFGMIPFLGFLLGMLLSLGSVILWLVLMVKAYQGERFVLPVVGEIAEKYSAPKA